MPSSQSSRRDGQSAASASDGHQRNQGPGGPPPSWPAGREFPVNKLQRIWLKGHRDYASMIPGAKVVIAETGHLIQEEDPELVIEEITQVVEQARSR